MLVFRIQPVFWIFLATLFAATIKSSASVVSGFDVSAMTQASDLIVTGQVVNLGYTQREGKDIEVFKILPMCVLKGKVPETLSATLPVYSGASLQILKNGEFGLFFLRSVENVYTVADVNHPILMSVPQCNAIPGSDSLAAVASAIAEVFTMSPSQIRLIGAGLDRPLSSGKSGEHVYSDAFDEIATIPSLVASRTVKLALTRSKDATSRMWGNALEVRYGDEQSLAELTNNLGANAPRSKLLITYICNAIELHEYWTDSAIPYFAKMLGFGDVQLRQAAAYALRSNHSNASVALLRDTALVDTDEEVRTYAVRGLCEATRTCNGIEQINYYARPENRGELVTMVNKALENPR